MLNKGQPAQVDGTSEFAELLEKLLDDDGVLPAGGQFLGLQQYLGGKGVLWGLGHVEVPEVVELPHARGGGDGEQEVAGLGVGVGRLDTAEGEASLEKQVADVTEAVSSSGEWSSCYPSRCWICLKCFRVFVSGNISYLFYICFTLVIGQPRTSLA